MATHLTVSLLELLLGPFFSVMQHWDYVYIQGMRHTQTFVLNCPGPFLVNPSLQIFKGLVLTLKLGNFLLP